MVTNKKISIYFLLSLKIYQNDNQIRTPTGLNLVRNSLDYYRNLIICKNLKNHTKPNSKRIVTSAKRHLVEPSVELRFGEQQAIGNFQKNNG